MNHSSTQVKGWKGIINLAFSPENFFHYCKALQWSAWKPTLLVLHNTAAPTLAQRPAGLSPQHIQNLQTYYRDIKKWDAGPHLFIDDRQIWVFTPLTLPGVHSPSWNTTAIGIEMLGNYETENFRTGRGLQVRRNTISAIATLITVLKLSPDALKLHREDHLTTHNCPGKNVRKDEMVQEIQQRLTR